MFELNVFIISMINACLVWKVFFFVWNFFFVILDRFNILIWKLISYIFEQKHFKKTILSNTIP